jgi:hypothetical protein
MTETRKPPHIEGARGLTWKPRVRGRWECRWHAQKNIIEAGWEPKSIRLWAGTPEELSPAIAEYIRERANDYQGAMLNWHRGELPRVPTLPGTVKTWAQLCDAYEHDPDSNFKTLRYKTRTFYKVQMKKIVTEHGAELIEKTNARLFLRWHEAWLANKDGPPKITAAASGITMCRILTNFGATILENKDCKEAADTLSRMKFKSPKPRESFLVFDQVEAIREQAHKLGHPSVALAQAFQFECIFRQRDCLGEWIPISEPGVSDVHDGDMKWLRGIRWEEIDQNMILRHVTSKRQKLVTVPLSAATMVMDEMQKIFGTTERAKLPASGPVIIDERFGVPWLEQRFRYAWRKCATAAGVPKSVKNMDSRAGAISEATDAGAPIEHVRHAAAHSQTQQTEKYSRNPEIKTANVLSIRNQGRVNKKGT